MTSVVRKTLKRLVLQFLKSIIDPLLDRFKFAYHENRSVDEAVFPGLFYVLQHLDSPDTYARILVVDYSSAINIIIPSKLFEKIQNVDAPQSMCLWILLLNRSQVVELGGNMSSSLTLSTATPQGCVLSPMLYSLLHMIDIVNHSMVWINHSEGKAQIEQNRKNCFQNNWQRPP